MTLPRPYLRLAGNGIHFLRAKVSSFALAGRWLVAGLLLAAAVDSPLPAQTSRENDLKAVLLYNLLGFVDWPKEAFASPGSPIIIGIVGHDPFGRVLDDVVRNERVNGRPILVERYRTRATLQKCHVLFVSDSEERDLRRINEAIEDRATLTVSDMRDFAKRGGMVGFFKNEEDKIRLQINLAEARKHGLQISAKLLRVADVLGAGASQP